MSAARQRAAHSGTPLAPLPVRERRRPVSRGLPTQAGGAGGEDRRRPALPEFARTAKARGVNSSLLLPLAVGGVVGDESLGALTLYSRSERGTPPTTRRRGLLFAAQASVAVANAKVYWSPRAAATRTPPSTCCAERRSGRTRSCGSGRGRGGVSPPSGTAWPTDSRPCFSICNRLLSASDVAAGDVVPPRSSGPVSSLHALGPLGGDQLRGPSFDHLHAAVARARGAPCRARRSGHLAALVGSRRPCAG